jgi:hypothetical protein
MFACGAFDKNTLRSESKLFLGLCALIVGKIIVRGESNFILGIKKISNRFWKLVRTVKKTKINFEKQTNSIPTVQH